MSKTLYEQDFQVWLTTTISHLQKREFADLDTDNLIEELTELGKSEKRALESNLMVLLAHLLKLKVQHDAPPSMRDSWYRSIIEHRQRIQKNLRDTPSLKYYLETAIQEAYLDAVKWQLRKANSLDLAFAFLQKMSILKFVLSCQSKSYMRASMAIDQKK